jgi:diguanylate cyclase (GGDEF)-like protein
MSLTRYNKPFIILTAVLTFVIISGVLYCCIQPSGVVLYQWEQSYNNNHKTLTLPSIEPLTSSNTQMSLHTSFPRQDVDALIIPRVDGNAVEVRLNNRLIYKVGETDQPTANLWNTVLLIPLLDPLQDNNTLDIQITSSYYGVGVSAVPYLMKYEEGAVRVHMINWLFNDLISIVSGASLVLGFILITLCLMRYTIRKPEFFVGLALIFCCIYNQDMNFRLTSGNLQNFLVCKKIFTISIFIAILSFSYGLELFIKNKIVISHWISVLASISILGLLFSPDLYWLTQINVYSNEVVFIILIVLVFMTAYYSPKSNWLLYITVLLGLCVLQYIVAIPFNISTPPVLPYAMTIIAFIFGSIQVFEFNHLFKENITLRYTNNLDPLTGALNRRGVKKLYTNIYDYVIMIDLDQFKELNDTHGHIFGDRVLICFTEITRCHLRQHDLIVRWGGDEFLIALNGIPKNEEGFKMVEGIIFRIAEQYAVSFPNLSLSFSYGIKMISGSFETCLNEADQLMYKMKEERRLTNEKK